MKSLFSRFSEIAISSVGYLAEVYDEDTAVYSSAEIAEARKLTQIFVAKVLTILSKHGVVDGAKGPGGGYRLARPPQEISLWEVVHPFQAEDDEFLCPFGPGYCGTGSPCPLHDYIVAVRERNEAFLKLTNLDTFQAAAKRRDSHLTRTKRSGKSKVT